MIVSILKKKPKQTNPKELKLPFLPDENKRSLEMIT